MASYTKDYSKIADPGKKRQYALEDIRQWLGIKKYEETTRNIRDCKPAMTWNQFQMMCMVGGIQGYPVTAWAEECGIFIPPADSIVPEGSKD